MHPFASGVFCIGNDADSFSEYFPGKIYLNECYLLQKNTNSQQGCGKYILRPLSEAMTIITLDPAGGTGGDTTVTATYGQDMPTIAIPTREGYIFGGYWSG